MSEQTPVPAQQFEPLPPVGGRSRLILVVIAAVVILGLVVAGVLIGTNSDDDTGPTGTASTAPLTASCGDAIARPTDGKADHARPGTDIDYADAPPAFGSHYDTWLPYERAFYAPQDRPEIAYLVHNLEHGYTIVWYDEAVAADEGSLEQLQELAEDYQDSNTGVIVVPWLTSDGEAFPEGQHLAVTRWSADPANQGDVTEQRGNWLYCGGVDTDAIDDFVQTWSNDESAEPGLIGR